MELKEVQEPAADPALTVGGAYPDDPVRTVAAADAVQSLQEADEAVQEDPVSTGGHPSTSSLPVDVPVSFAVCHLASPPCWQQEEACPPKLERVDQTVSKERGR